MLTEEFKYRIKALAGIKNPLNEISDKVKYALMDKSKQRIPFNLEFIKDAINNGLEIGMGFQSNNQSYKMPMMKYRIVWPVAIGTNKKGKLQIRGYHIAGQSEKKAIDTGVRSAEAQNEWRLFNVSNIKSIWLTGRYFSSDIPGYNPNDSHLNNILASYNPQKAKAAQQQLKAQPEPAEEPVANVATTSNVIPSPVPNQDGVAPNTQIANKPVIKAPPDPSKNAMIRKPIVKAPADPSKNAMSKEVPQEQPPIEQNKEDNINEPL